ncbi:adenine methyltransferase [Enterobacteriaceae bacterium ML5]|nr:adenine methyltransferase [Enterobacteriaceae bacterium ML5]
MMYQLIYADPPWQYSNKISNGAADDHYSTMTLEEIKRLPVWSIAAENAVLAMWYTGNFAAEAVELAQAWGFKVKTMKGFTWIKLYEQARGRIERALAEQTMIDFEDFLDALSAETVMNGGNYTRGNSEDVLIATRGAGLERVSASVKQVVHSCRGEHSEKPAEVRLRLEELYGSVARIELFSRGDAAGWHHWGNENPFNDIDLVPATFTTMPAARNSRVKAQTGYYQAIAGALQQTQQQKIPEIIPVPETNNRVWPEEVHFLFNQVADSSNLDAHLQNKLLHHINRLKMDGMPVDQIIDTAGTLARKMGATA